MSFVIRFAEFVGYTTGPGVYQMPAPGDYLTFFDPEHAGGQGLAQWSTSPDRALLFLSMDEAAQFYMQTSTWKPWREDGNPNRPLTSASVYVEYIPEKRL